MLKGHQWNVKYFRISLATCIRIDYITKHYIYTSIYVFQFKWIITVVWPGGPTTKYVVFLLSRFPNLGHEQNNRPIWTFYLIHQCFSVKQLIHVLIMEHLYGDFLRCNLWKDSLWILFSSVTYIYLALLYVLFLNYTIYVNKNRTDFTNQLNYTAQKHSG